MKLIFPNGEHGPVLLSAGRNRIGSAVEASVRLPAAAVAPELCEIELGGNGAVLRLSTGSSEVTVNGQIAEEGQSLRAGDQLVFGTVQARLVAVERVAAASSARTAPVDDAGATRVRAALPRYVLRGVSGAAFGKTFPITGALVIGRQQDCDIAVPSEEISRRHAQVKPTPDGLAVEDLGSSNGTFINGNRVQQGMMKPGDELRLDAIRFLLVAPGQEMPKSSASAAPAAAETGGSKGLVIGLVIAAVAAAGIAVFLLR